MIEPTGTIPASDLPKSLRNILDVLIRDNGLVSWQIYSQKNGVSVRIKFGQTQDGGQCITSGNNRACYSKKSPSQMRRDDKKAQERRITRQQTRNFKESDHSNIEQPRCDSKNIADPSTVNGPCSPVTPLPERSHTVSMSQSRSSLPVDRSADKSISDIAHSTMSHSQSAEPVKCSTPANVVCKQAAAIVEEHVNTELDGASEEESEYEDSYYKYEIDSDDCEFGPDYSLPRFRYVFLKPVDRRCTYCGTYKGKHSKTIMECKKDGRKICLRCIDKCHRRHRRHFVECTTNYVHDGDSN